MLAHEDYQFPFAAAQLQYRSHYYGLSSAALLEDVYFDAFSHFLQKHEGVTLGRPPRGQKGWDYEYKGLEVSHKIQQKVSLLAILWDATVEGFGAWTGQQTLVLGLGSPLNLKHILPSGRTGQATAVCAPSHQKRSKGITEVDPGHSVVKKGKSLLLVKWPAGTTKANILYRVDADESQKLVDIAPFSEVWGHVRQYLKGETPRANDLEMVTVTTNNLPRDAADIDLEAELRAGIYVVGTDHQKDIPTASNNRAVTVPTAQVKAILKKVAEEENTVIPSPAWFGFYTRNRPPDLFLAQLDEFQEFFSAAAG